VKKSASGQKFKFWVLENRSRLANHFDKYYHNANTFPNSKKPHHDMEDWLEEFRNVQMVNEDQLERALPGEEFLFAALCSFTNLRLRVILPESKQKENREVEKLRVVLFNPFLSFEHERGGEVVIVHTGNGYSFTRYRYYGFDYSKSPAVFDTGYVDSKINLITSFYNEEDNSEETLLTNLSILDGKCDDIIKGKLKVVSNEHNNDMIQFRAFQTVIECSYPDNQINTPAENEENEISGGHC